jgi:hypothetical protein
MNKLPLNLDEVCAVWKRSTKIVVAILGFAYLLYQAPDVRDEVGSLLDTHPHIVSAIVICAAIWGVTHQPKETAGQ